MLVSASESILVYMSSYYHDMQMLHFSEFFADL